MFKTIKESVSGEIVEKKSKFIANVFYVETVEEAENKIKEVSRKYFDSKHNCYAFSIYTENGLINRFSDNRWTIWNSSDGPILNIITSRKLSNVLVVVTRYFGGILLGTGGLVRSYSEATNTALEKAEIIEKDLGKEAILEVNYSDLQKLKYYFDQNSIKIIKEEFEENIKILFEISEEKINNLASNIENLNFKFSNLKIIREKYINI